MKITNYHSDRIKIEFFEACPGQAWCIHGSNRSGIEDFFTLLAEETEETSKSQIQRPTSCGLFSFADQQARFEQELKNNDTDFMDRIDPGTPARDLLVCPEDHRALIRAFDLDKVLDQGISQLSTGQYRKLLLLAQGIQIIITVHNPEDIPCWATHLGIMDQGRLAFSGEKDILLNHWPSLTVRPDFKVSMDDILKQDKKKSMNSPATGSREGQELVRLENGKAGYLGKPVFQNLDLVVCKGDHTLISGPNGCGKSTLIQVITGDHPACYQNRLWLFNIRRGTGESIWELKKNMGIVSPDLHKNHMVPGSALDCVLSGLFDSIGLYTRPQNDQIKTAMTWLERINLRHRAQTPFRALSYADQRLVLIARALIKLPCLLILDEPTQGLDRANREALLNFLARAEEEKITTILYVSHRQDEFKDFFVHHLQMEKQSSTQG
ncbi:MAG: ATP-binding cassette domain-containing protein [Desulfobacter sp.]|nr:MAG: ATP-binding cassette domain-containing protein [Desulfobacter sp.]